MGFSVIMPTFRREHAIHRAIKSLQDQIYKDWELIVVDNYGSNYSFDDERISCHVFTAKRGAHHARNFGIPFASKELICFLDDDDVFMPHYMRKFDLAFQNPVVKMARCRMLLAGRELMDLATPQVVLRREYATPTWIKHTRHDKIYFTSIMDSNKWLLNKPMVRSIQEPLCQALHDSKGGLRDPEGKL